MTQAQPAAPNHALPYVHELGPAVLRHLQQEAAIAHGLEAYFADPLASGGLGPEMAVIPPGIFTMGAPEEQRRAGELSQQQAVMETAYAIGRYTVTADEFERFAQATGFVWGDHLLRTLGRQPVTNINSEHASSYLDWLSAESGRRYRLPTETEWEYAARAGSLTAYCFGERLNCGVANIGALMTSAAKSGWRRLLPFCIPLSRTCEVGSYPANVWGLSEVHGNVWEFTADPWTGSFDRIHQAHAGHRRRLKWIVTKGGSWFDGLGDARSAARKARLEDELDTNLGLRVAREI